jgi:hypothetical protein
MSIPIVVIHKGSQTYVEKALQIIRKTNKLVYLLGDDSNKHFEKSCDIQHIPIKSLEVTKEQAKFIKSFVNYSTNPYDYELVCFLRVFWLGEFMKKFKYERVFHLDSDCILLYDINTYKFTSDIAYIVNSNFENPFRMASSIHSALLNMDFVDKFTQLCTDIYINKTKLKLIEKKVNYHKANKVPGGICDMTLYYLLIQEGLKVQPLNVETDGFIFINNINGAEGPESREQYEKNGTYMRIFDGNRIYDNKNEKYVNLFSIHYQGGAKQLLLSY